MKKFSVYMILMAGLITLISFGMAAAADQILDAKVDSVTQLIDKNGNAFTRVIVTEERSIEGTKYSKGVPVMFFGEMAAIGSTFKAGETLRVVANYNTEYDSYTVLQVIAD